MKNEEIKTVTEQGEALVHFNARVPKKMKSAVTQAIKRSGIRIEHVAQDAWRHYFGVHDPVAESRRSVVLEAFKQIHKGNKRPFDSPATPFTNNGHLNGIVAVASSSLADSSLQNGIGYGCEIRGESGISVAGFAGSGGPAAAASF